MDRLRRALAVGAACAAAGGVRGQPAVRAGTAITLPRDFGAHPEFRTEWWYVTGWLAPKADGFGASAPGGAEAAETFGVAESFGSAETSGFAETFGFQITFFRTRTDLVLDQHPSAFAARQLVFAHAAVSDVQARRLRHDQRIARAGFDIAGAAPQDTDLRLRGWTLRRIAEADRHHYVASVASSAQDFALQLRLDATQPVLLQGQAGYSRKGPEPVQASHYLSEPQLVASGTLVLDGRPLAMRGRAWLDHEWSEALMHPDAVGWDWIGMNLDDGSALTAFRLRRADGSALWAGGSHRARGGAPRAFATDAVAFTPLAWWTSPTTRARYPVRWRIATPAGTVEVRALFEAQELDASGSTGSVYWEGLSELLDGASGRRIGRGYLEMTGYAGALKL